MTRSREDGFINVWNILGIVVIAVIVVGISLWVIFEGHYARVAKENFNIKHLTLSEQERVMIRPMVENVLERLREEANIAKEEEDRLSKRKDITRYNVEQAIIDLRSARKRAYEAHDKLTNTCNAAIYFYLVERNLEWCK